MTLRDTNEETQPRFLKKSALAMVLSIALAGVCNPAVQESAVERFEAFAVNMGNIGAGANSTVNIQIERWSTDVERKRLIAAFEKNRQDGLLNELQKVNPRVGYINLPGSIGYDLRYAREVPGEKGERRILIATDRPIGVAEARNQPRTIDYPFTLIELRLDKAGNGEGRMSIATKIRHNKKTNVLELENYNSEPVRLNQVRKAK
jgi:hypothetical protein